MLTREQVVQRLEKACKDAGSQNLWAKANGISQSYVSDVIRGNRGVGDLMLKALGLKRIERYDVDD